MTAWEKKAATAELPSIAKYITESLPQDRPFCLWLKGNLGAGKTTLTGHILRQLGLSDRIPVTSPTYTYMNEYEAKGRWYAHLDLYRAHESLGIEDLGLLDARPFFGVFIEWPEQIPASPSMQPTHIIEINFTEDPSRRLFCFSTVT